MIGRVWRRLVWAGWHALAVVLGRLGATRSPSRDLIDAADAAMVDALVAMRRTELEVRDAVRRAQAVRDAVDDG